MKRPATWACASDSSILASDSSILASDSSTAGRWGLSPAASAASRSWPQWQSLSLCGS